MDPQDSSKTVNAIQLRDVHDLYKYALLPAVAEDRLNAAGLLPFPPVPLKQWGFLAAAILTRRADSQGCRPERPEFRHGHQGSNRFHTFVAGFPIHPTPALTASVQTFGLLRRGSPTLRVQPNLRTCERRSRLVERGLPARDVEKGVDISVSVLNREEGKTKMRLGLMMAHDSLLSLSCTYGLRRAANVRGRRTPPLRMMRGAPSLATALAASDWIRDAISYENRLVKTQDQTNAEEDGLGSRLGGGGETARRRNERLLTAPLCRQAFEKLRWTTDQPKRAGVAKPGRPTRAFVHFIGADAGLGLVRTGASAAGPRRPHSRRRARRGRILASGASALGARPHPHGRFSMRAR